MFDQLNVPSKIETIVDESFTMVKLTASLIEKKRLFQQSQKHLTKETDKDDLKKITHLFMNDQCIGEIVNNKFIY